MVSQQGYLSGETEARSCSRVRSQTWEQELENPPWGLVRRCCLEQIGGENEPPPSPGHRVCWYAPGSSVVPGQPADPWVLDGSRNGSDMNVTH